MEDILRVFTLTPIDGLMILVSCPLFFLLWTILDKVCFKHFRNVVEEREAVTSGKVVEAKKLIEKANELNSMYEHSIQEARVKYTKDKEKKLEQARKEAGDILASGAVEIEKITNEGKAKNETLITKALSDLQHDSEKLTTNIIDRVTALSI